MFSVYLHQADFPTTVGILEQGENSVDSMRDKKYYIDTVNVKVPRSSMELVNFLQDGSSEQVIRSNYFL